MDPSGYLCFVSVMLSCLFIAALWSPAGTSYLVCDVFVCLCHFTRDDLGQVWYLIVWIPDICLLP